MTIMKYEHLSHFTQGYIDAMFFTETGPDNPEFEGLGFYDLAPETLTRIVSDCASFEMSNKSLLDKAGYSPEYAGHDFWLTRNCHGAGFWDRSGIAKDIGETLTEKAQAMGELSLYAGDDGLLYLQ